MDLALAFGRPDIQAFKRAITEKDLSRWRQYAEQRMLPQRRIELYLARLCLICSRGAVTEPGEISDYLFDYIFEPETGEDEPVTEEDIVYMRNAMGWGPRGG